MKHFNESIFDIDDKSITNKTTTKAKDKKHLIKLLEDYVHDVQFDDEKHPYNTIIDLNWIDVSSVTDFSRVFFEAGYGFFNFDVSKWNMSNATNIESMFEYCNFFDGDLSEWKLPKITDFTRMFSNCKHFTGKGLNKWDVSKGVSFTQMFLQCQKLDLNEIKGWNMENAVSVRNMFEYFGEDGKGDVTKIINWKLSRAIAHLLNEYTK